MFVAYVIDACGLHDKYYSYGIVVYLFILLRILGNVFGLCLRRKLRKPKTYFSKYTSQLMSQTSTWKFSRSLMLI